MLEVELLIQHLISDTNAEIIHWSRIGSWGNGPCSSDFRDINPVLAKLTDNDPFAFDHWSNAFIADVLTGFVYLLKIPNVPPRYSIYLQLDCHSKITRLNASSQSLQPLYEAVSNQLIIDDCEILNFLDYYHNSHCQKDPFEP